MFRAGYHCTKPVHHVRRMTPPKKIRYQPKGRSRAWKRSEAASAPPQVRRKRHYEPHGNHRKRCCCQYVSGLPEVVNRSSENRRNRQEEREFRCRFSRQTDAKTADNSCAGAASARNHGQTLQETDLQSVFPTHVIHRFYTRFVGFLVLVILNDENNHTAHDQSCRNRDRIKEPFFM